MKALVIRCACLIAVLSVLLPLCGCSGEKKLRIGISQCSQDDWRAKMNEEIEREILLHPEAEVEIRSADDSSARQCADIRYFMDNDFDIIIVSPNEADGLTPVIAEAYNKGIPVIVFDRDIHGQTYTSRQTVDNEELGEQAARYASTLIPDGGKVIEIRGLDGSTPADGRSRGFKTRARKEGLEIVASAAGNWLNDRAEKVADSMLTAHPDADLIYAHNDRMAIAAAQVAGKKGLKPKIIGIDAAPEIGIRAVSDGVIDATFVYATEGHRLIRTALAILKGELFERDVLLPNTSAVDKSNADILLLQNEQLQDETRKMTALKSQVDDYWNRHSAQTTLFYAAVVILVLLCGLLFMLLRAFWTHKHHQKELLEQNRLLEQQRDNERALNEQLNLATQSKLVFFTNVSHDLRTPLTLIAEPVEQLAKAGNLTEAQHTLATLANKNVKILRRLINQILDFRKYENGRMNLDLSEVEIGSLINEWCDSFKSVARKSGLRLNVNISLPERFTIACDVEKIERVFFNILSNALKYTPRGGKIDVDVTESDDYFRIVVADTGRGISADDLPNIFDRFFQVDKVHPNGSGIGLSLAKAFVELHGGSIGAVSEYGKGSRFTVSIPVSHIEQSVSSESAAADSRSGLSDELDYVSPPPCSGDESLPLALVIDDNPDIRSMIRVLLDGRFRFIEAENGKDGVHLAAKYIPDIVICDIMMPVMDGLECCRLIKDEMSTAHIPVLMLTACSMDEQRMQGYESGADAYLSKPFSADMLRARCANLIENRLRLRRAWIGSDGMTLAEGEPSDKGKPAAPRQNDFYDRFRAIVAQRIADPDLSVDALAAELGIGRSQFYRKIKSISGYSPVELLRNIRLAKARELLLTSDLSISEIAYAVGFSSPAYFTRCYKVLYSETPSEIRERL